MRSWYCFSPRSHTGLTCNSLVSENQTVLLLISRNIDKQLWNFGIEIRLGSTLIKINSKYISSKNSKSCLITGFRINFNFVFHRILPGAISQTLESYCNKLLRTMPSILHGPYTSNYWSVFTHPHKCNQNQTTQFSYSNIQIRQAKSLPNKLNFLCKNNF